MGGTCIFLIPPLSLRVSTGPNTSNFRIPAPRYSRGEGVRSKYPKIPGVPRGFLRAVVPTCGPWILLGSKEFQI